MGVCVWCGTKPCTCGRNGKGEKPKPVNVPK